MNVKFCTDVKPRLRMHPNPLGHCSDIEVLCKQRAKACRKRWHGPRQAIALLLSECFQVKTLVLFLVLPISFATAGATFVRMSAAALTALPRIL